MDALIVDDAAPQRLRHSHIPTPAPTAHEALIETSAVSVNPTDLALLDAAPNRTVLGYEFSGIVLQPALDGTGPPAGARVAGMVMGGAWAQRVAVPSAQLAVVPEGIDLQSAATVPIAGVSALRALHAGGAILGRRVLVTGATGAVGACAVQLASVGGAAAIVAVARSQEYSDRLRTLGATRVVTNPREGGELADTVIDTVGGDLLPDAFAMTAAGGDLISVGRASGDDIVLPAQALEGAGGRSGRTIHTFFMPDESGDYGSDLRFILDLVSSGRLDVGVDHVEELRGDLSLLLWNMGRKTRAHDALVGPVLLGGPGHRRQPVRIVAVDIDDDIALIGRDIRGISSHGRLTVLARESARVGWLNVDAHVQSGFADAVHGQHVALVEVEVEVGDLRRALDQERGHEHAVVGELLLEVLETLTNQLQPFITIRRRATGEHEND